MTTIDRGPRRDIVPNGGGPRRAHIGIHVGGRAANALILGLALKEVIARELWPEIEDVGPEHSGKI